MREEKRRKGMCWVRGIGEEGGDEVSLTEDDMVQKERAGEDQLASDGGGDGGGVQEERRCGVGMCTKDFRGERDKWKWRNFG